MDSLDVLIIGILLAVTGLLALLFIGRMVWYMPAESIDSFVQNDRDLALEGSLKDYRKIDNSESNCTDFEKSYQLLRDKISLFKERNSYYTKEHSYSEKEY